MEWATVRVGTSDAVTMVAYSERRRVLLVDFRRTGTRYAYLDIAPRMWTIFEMVARLAGVSLGGVMNQALFNRQLGYRVG